MFSALFILIIGMKSAVTVDISVNVQLGKGSDSSSCGKDSFTASNEEELREKLAQKLESVLLENQDDSVTISSYFRYYNELHSPDITKLVDTTDDVTNVFTTSQFLSTEASDASTSALSNTDNFIDYTLATDDDITGLLANTTDNGSHTDYITKTDKATKYFNSTSSTSAAYFTFESITPKKYRTTAGQISSIGSEHSHTTIEADKISSTDIDSFTTDTTVKSLFPKNCDVSFDQNCFRVIVYPTQNVTFTNAESICSNMGWNLSNVYNEAHYWMLTSYMRPKIYPDTYYFRVWTGMTFKNGRIHLTSGDSSTLPTSVWYPDYPTSSKKNHIGIDVNVNPQGQGMFNASPNNKYHGALCELEAN